MLSVPVAGDADGPEATSAIRHLRADLIPQAFGGARRRRSSSAERPPRTSTTSTSSATGSRSCFAFVLGLSFILLTVAFRSIVIPAVAIALNLLSVGAAYGLLVLVFQKGVGNELFGFQQVDTIEAGCRSSSSPSSSASRWTTRCSCSAGSRSATRRPATPLASVAFGVGSTARLITGAALIIIAVFSGFAAGDLVMFQQMGFGVAVALLVDATIVRCVLVPASMKLLGERNWYLPSWLQLDPGGSRRRAGFGGAAEANRKSTSDRCDLAGLRNLFLRWSQTVLIEALS